jgi:hypothetical protein
MEVAPLSSIPAWACVWSNAARKSFATIVCKATFELRPDLMSLASEQLPLLNRDSAYAPSDLAPFKPRADVALVGSAHPPRGYAESTLEATLRVGSVHKRVAIDVSRHVGRPTPTDAFAPLTPLSEERRRKLGPHAGTFDHDRWYLKPLPADIDPAFFNTAPADQQLDRLTSDMEIVLRNLHPKHTDLVARFPGDIPFVFIERGDDEVQILDLVCDALWIDTDRGLCSLTWRSQIALSHLDEPVRALVLFGPAASPPDYEQANRTREVAGLLAPAALEETFDAHETVRLAPGAKIPDATVSLEDLVAKAVLPFVRRADSLPPPPMPPSPSIHTGTADLADAVAAVPAALAEPVARVRTQHRSAPPVVPPRGRRSPWSDGVSDKQSSVAPRFTAQHDAEPLAALGGVAAASEAARRATEAAEKRRKERDREGSAPSISPAIAPGAGEVEPVHLVWFERSAMAQVRKRWRRIVTEHDLRPLPPGDVLDGDADDSDVQDRSRVHDVMSRASTVTATQLAEEIRSAVQAHGRFAPPLVVIDGALALPFDEVEELRATCTAMTPFAPGDKKLRELLDAAGELLRLDYLEGAGDVARTLTERLHECFGKMPRAMTRETLVAHVTRMLLERRRHQKRQLWGASWLRGLLATKGADEPLVAYLPESIASELPLFRRLAVRLIAAAEHRQDEHERAPVALRVVALATRPATDT